VAQTQTGKEKISSFSNGISNLLRKVSVFETQKTRQVLAEAATKEIRLLLRNFVTARGEERCEACGDTHDKALLHGFTDLRGTSP